jgi:hypothetical protein
VLLEASAVGLPFKVSVHVTAPVPVTVAALQLALMPLGSPVVIVALAPAAAAGTVTPPCGVAVTVTDAVPIDCIERLAIDNCICTPGAWLTMAVYSQATESPSPVAVTVKVYQLAGTAVVAESVSVDEPVFELSVT